MFISVGFFIASFGMQVSSGVVREERLELEKNSGIKSAIQEQALKQHEVSPSAADELIPLNDEKKQSELAQMIHLNRGRVIHNQIDIMIKANSEEFRRT